MTPSNCDSESGLCTPAALGEGQGKPASAIQDQELIYVGDPMCSWCWGLSPALKQLAEHCSQENIPFRVVVGGLRPGGGDPWNQQFKDFLRHHWEEIGQRSGQAFAFRLLDRDSFNYDTEPACRAIVAARPLLQSRELEFFEAVQRKFYVDNEDPKEAEFYKSLCQKFGLDYDAFIKRFQSDKVKRETAEEFQLNRSWGVRGYPSVLFRHGQSLATIAVGFSTIDVMKTKIQRLRATPA